MFSRSKTVSPSISSEGNVAIISLKKTLCRSQFPGLQYGRDAAQFIKKALPIDKNTPLPEAVCIGSLNTSNDLDENFSSKILDLFSKENLDCKLLVLHGDKSTFISSNCLKPPKVSPKMHMIASEGIETYLAPRPYAKIFYDTIETELEKDKSVHEIGAALSEKLHDFTWVGTTGSQSIKFPHTTIMLIPAQTTPTPQIYAIFTEQEGCKPGYAQQYANGFVEKVEKILQPQVTIEPK